MLRKSIMLALMLAVMSVVIGAVMAQDDGSSGNGQAFTHQRADGNRFVAGSGDFPQVQAIDVLLPDAPVWVVGAVAGENLLRWYVTTAVGEVYSIDIAFDGTVGAATPAALVQPGTPPYLRVTDTVEILDFSELTPAVSALTHPVIVDTNWLYIATNGDVILANSFGEIAHAPLDALPDGRLAQSGDGRVALYVGTTNERYVHSIMGDDLEAASLVVLEAATLDILARIDLDSDAVFEGLQPIWADIDEDGVLDLIVTVSTARDGAQIRAYRVDGTLLASGPTIGQGNRWRHQLAWGAFGPSGEYELVEVLTPHIGGIVGFYRYDGHSGLEIVARQNGYTSHVIGSRNLDMALGGDFDGDGQPEIVLPDQARERIAGLTHIGTTVVESWSLPLDGTLASNLAAITLPDESLRLAAGVSHPDSDFLRIWQG